MEVNDSDIKDYRLHLESISCEISDIKFSLVSILNKVECNISFFVSFKEKLSVLETYQGDVHLFESFLSELKEEILNTDAKASLLEEKTSYFCNLLEKNEGTCIENQTFKLKTEQIDGDEIESNFSKNNVDEDDNDIDSRSENNEELLEGTVKSMKLSNKHLDRIHRKRKKSSPNKTKYHQKSEGFSRNSQTTPNSSRVNRVNLKLNPFDFIRFKCILCSEMFTKKQSFKKHQEIHKKEYSFMCNMCGVRVKEEAILEDHKEKNHKINGTEFNNELQCYICNKLCSTLSNLSRHIQRNHTRYFECPICGRNYRDLSVFDSHYSLHRNVTDVKCIYCENRFINESQLKKHVSEKHENENNPEICKMEMDNKSDIENINQLEKEIKDDEEKYLSDSTIFNDDAKPMDHYKMDAEFADGDSEADLLGSESNMCTPTNYQCKMCAKYYPNSTNLLMHILEKYSMVYFLKYQCEICSRKFEESNVFQEHKKIEHSYENPHHCTICSKTFAVETDLNKHLRSEHGHGEDTELESENKSYKCEHCGKQYEIISSLIRHKRVHTEEIFECLLCAKNYKDRDELRKHFYGHILKSMECPYCNKVFDDRNELTSHMLTEHNFEIPLYFVKRYALKTSSGDGKYSKSINTVKELKTDTSIQNHIWKLTCQICLESFSSRGCYLKHRKTHTAEELSFLSPKNKSDISINLEWEKISNSNGPSTFNCKICNKTFNNKTIIERHLLTHTGDRPYQCTSCGECYNDSSNLRRHIAVSHPSADGNLFCFTCKEQFDTIEALTEHKLTHVGEKPHQCIACGRCFSHKNNLRSHVCLAKLDKEKLFTCEICSNKYHTNFQLKVHIRKVHGKGKSLVCEFCGWTFSQKCNLDQHRFIHTGGKPLLHKCSVCNKWFKDSGYLKQHMNIHTGKRFSCHLCGNSFAYMRGLQRHMKETCKIKDNLPLDQIL